MSLKAKNKKNEEKKTQEDSKDEDKTSSPKAKLALGNTEKKMAGQKAQEYFKNGLALSKKAKNKTEYAEALDCYTMAITLKSSNPRYYFARGNTYRIINEYKRAVLDYSSAIRLDSGTANYFSNRGQSYRKMGKPQVALNDFEAAIALEPGNTNFFFQRGMALYDCGLYQKAIKDFTTALKDKKLTYRAYYNRGNCYRRLKQLDASIDDLSQALNLEPRNPSAHNNLGLSFFENKNYDSAIKCFADSISIDSDNPTFYNNKGLALYHRGDVDEALADLNEAIARDSARNPDPNYYFNRGNARLSRKENRKALADFEEACRFAPKDARYRHAVGLARQQSDGEEEMALEQFELALELDPNHIPSLYHRGLMLHRLHRLDEAVDVFSAVLEHAKNDRLVYESRGLVYQDLRLHVKAVDDFTTALKIDQHIGENHYHRGESLLRLGDLKNAILDFKAALDLNYADPLVFNARGMTKRALGHFDEAIDDLTDALQHAPENVEFLLNRSLCFLDVDDPGSAEQDMHDAIAVNSRDYRLHQRRGEARLLLHEFDLAIEDLKEALKCDPTASSRIDIQRTLGYAYANSDRHANALEYFWKAKDNAAIVQTNNTLDKSIIAPEIRQQELLDDEMDMHEIAKSLQMIGEYDDAIKYFTNVIDLNPRNAHAYFRRAFAYKSVKEFEMAAEDFERAKELDPENPHLAINYRNLYDVECIVLCDSGREPIY